MIRTTVQCFLAGYQANMTTFDLCHRKLLHVLLLQLTLNCTLVWVSVFVDGTNWLVIGLIFLGLSRRKVAKQARKTISATFTQSKF